jgi:hypothetical protein
MNKQSIPSNKLLLASVMSSLLCGSIPAYAYNVTWNSFNSPRNNAKLDVYIDGDAPSNELIYVWTSVKNVGEFCYSPPGGTTPVTWTPAIPTQPGGTVVDGTAKCPVSAGRMGNSKDGSHATVHILNGQDLSHPVSNGAMFYVGVGSSSGGVKIYTVPEGTKDKFTGDSRNSTRKNIQLDALIHLDSASNQVIYVWATVKNLGEFCYNPNYGWTPAIIDKEKGTVASGKAHCQVSAGKMGNKADATVPILKGMDWSSPLFDGTMIWVGLGDRTSGKLQSGYSTIYTVTP